MAICKSGRHHWISPEDAARCCDAAWTRVLLVGPEAAASAESLQLAGGSIYGRRWVRTADLGAFTCPR